MYVDELDIPPGKMAGSTIQVIERAVDEAHRRGHSRVTSEHVFHALARSEWDLFARVMHDAAIDPHVVLRAVDEYLRHAPSHEGDSVRVAPETRLVCKLAVQHASRVGHGEVQAVDLLLALLDESRGVPAAILRQLGAEPARLSSRLEAQMRDLELRNERLKKRFELPPTLKMFATNLNFLACQDKLPPVFGRDREIQQVLEILSHRERSNSVMLVGEPGVGKTAIAEGLARRIEFEPDGIPVRLRDAQIINLQLNAVVAGTMLRGMFEERLQTVIREVQEHPHLILFVDEAHTMVGAGTALGAPTDAGQIFKSVLARGAVRMIGATTVSEYKQHIQEDEALARRFRCVTVAEPTIEETREILYKLRPRVEQNYSVALLDEALEAALELSPRYMRHLRLPDKVIGWLETAAVRVEIDRRSEVTRDDVVRVISDSARIPQVMVSRDVVGAFRNVEERLQQRVVGQAAAVRAVAHRLRLNKGPLKDGFDRPDGVLLFAGPTGVGKTELAKAVAEYLFGDDKKMIRIDMSEYQDGPVSVDKLIGMPRGIAGNERGGILTSQLADNPCTVLLLDEIEKAGPTLLNLFLQAFDEGWLTDGRGRRVYLSDAIVIMTSNIGSGAFRKLTSPLGFRAHSMDINDVRSDITREIEIRFSPEFRNRIDDIVLFAPLTNEDVRCITTDYLSQLTRTLAGAGKTIAIENDAVDLIVRDGYNVAFGARFLKRVIDERIKLSISMQWDTASHFYVRTANGEVVVDAVAAAGVSSAHAAASA